MSAEGNRCVGTFGALYSSYIERERLAGVIGRVVWGIDVRPMYRSMRTIGEAPAGRGWLGTAGLARFDVLGRGFAVFGGIKPGP